MRFMGHTMRQDTPEEREAFLAKQKARMEQEKRDLDPGLCPEVDEKAKELIEKGGNLWQKYGKTRVYLSAELRRKMACDNLGAIWAGHKYKDSEGNTISKASVYREMAAIGDFYEVK